MDREPPDAHGRPAGELPQRRGRDDWRHGSGAPADPLLGIDTINQHNISLPALLVSLLGSIVLLAIVNLWRRGTVH